MSFTIELTTEQEDLIRARAAREGLDALSFVKLLVLDGIRASSTGLPPLEREPLTLEDMEHDFEWAVTRNRPNARHQ